MILYLATVIESSKRYINARNKHTQNAQLKQLTSFFYFAPMELCLMKKAKYLAYYSFLSLKFTSEAIFISGLLQGEIFTEPKRDGFILPFCSYMKDNGFQASADEFDQHLQSSLSLLR